MKPPHRLAVKDGGFDDKKVGIGCLLCLLLWSTLSWNPKAEVTGISAQSYLVMDAQTKEVLSAHHENEERGMASTTKIMTTLLTLEQEDLLDIPFEADATSLQVEGSSMGLLAGDLVTLRDLCYGMLLSSGNDSANLAATQVGGSVEDFVAMMNQKAQALGMKHTQFANPSGLTAEGHYSTAYDMALLASYAVTQEDFVAICSTTESKRTFGNPPTARWLENHNQLLHTYEGCIGMKTGYTKAAGRCLVSAATRDGKTLVCVTLSDPNDWQDHQRLLDDGFAQETQLVWSQEEQVQIPLTGGQLPQVTAKTKQTIETHQSGSATVCVLPFLYAPIQAGDVVGQVQITTVSETLMLPLYAMETVEKKEGQPQNTPFWEKINTLLAPLFTG